MGLKKLLDIRKEPYYNICKNYWSIANTDLLTPDVDRAMGEVEEGARAVEEVVVGARAVEEVVVGA